MEEEEYESFEEEPITKEGTVRECEAYREGYLTAYETGLADGRRQGLDSALFLIKRAFSNYYDSDVQEIVASLQDSLVEQ